MDQVFTFPKDSRICKYVSERIKKQAPSEMELSETEENLILKCKNTDLSADLISDVILLFYKAKEIASVILQKDFDGGLYACLLGAVTGVEYEKEKEYLSNVVSGLSVGSAKGVYDFLLGDVRENWHDLVKLCKKLYDQCVSQEDVLALCVFLIGMSDEIGNKITLSKKGCIFSGKKEKFLVPVFSDYEKDLLFTLSLLHPEDIVLERTDDLSQNLLRTIRALGC